MRQFRKFRKPSHFGLKIFFRKILPIFHKNSAICMCGIRLETCESAFERINALVFGKKNSTFLQIPMCEISPYFCGKWRYLRFPQVSRGFKICRNSATFRKSKGKFRIKTAVKNSKFFSPKTNALSLSNALSHISRQIPHIAYNLRKIRQKLENELSGG